MILLIKGERSAIGLLFLRSRTKEEVYGEKKIEIFFWEARESKEGSHMFRSTS